jgi:large subunit ribosomal protein L4
MLLDVVNIKNEKVGEIEVSDTVFGAEVKPHLHWEIVRYQQAKKRRGTHNTRTRGKVRGSTRKIYRQKGTGRARHGDIKAPIFVGGGVIFGPQPRDYSFNPPKKVRRGALISALSEKASDGRVIVVDSLDFDQPKTRQAVDTLKTLGVESALVVDLENENLKLSVRNLPKSKFLRREGVNVYDLLRHDHVVITQDAMGELNGALDR